VRESFAMRRKTLRNNLKKRLTAEQIESLGIDPGIRPEKLSVADYVRIADYVFDQAAKGTADGE